MQSVLDLAGAGATLLHSRLMTNCDVVRARSRAVRIALDQCFTHLLFWDSDVRGNGLLALHYMLGENVDIIGAAYPRKHLPAQSTHTPPYVGMGFTLLSTTCLEKMWDAYYDELYFDDLYDGSPHRSVALFQLLFEERPAPRYHRSLLGEDYSFCERWLRIGGSVHLYDGPGAPMDHVGGYVYSMTDAGSSELVPSGVGPSST